MSNNHRYSIPQQIELQNFMNGKVYRHMEDLKKAISEMQKHNTIRNFEIEKNRIAKLAMKDHYEKRIADLENEIADLIERYS